MTIDRVDKYLWRCAVSKTRALPVCVSVDDTQVELEHVGQQLDNCLSLNKINLFRILHYPGKIVSFPLFDANFVDNIRMQCTY